MPITLSVIMCNTLGASAQVVLAHKHRNERRVLTRQGGAPQKNVLSLSFTVAERNYWGPAFGCVRLAPDPPTARPPSGLRRAPDR